MCKYNENNDSYTKIMFDSLIYRKPTFMNDTNLEKVVLNLLKSLEDESLRDDYLVGYINSDSTVLTPEEYVDVKKCNCKKQLK